MLPTIKVESDKKSLVVRLCVVVVSFCFAGLSI